MKRIKVYLKLFWVNRYLIISGVFYRLRYIITGKPIWIETRMNACKGCAFNSENGIMPSKDPFRKDAHCTICMCNLFLKQSSPKSECALATITDDRDAIKWGAE